DALGLPFSPDVPPLDPPLARRDDLSSACSVTPNEWDAWLEQLVRAPAGGVHPPATGADLLTLFTELEEEARVWEDSVVRLGPYRPAWIPALLQDASARGVTGLRHHTEVVPVRGPWNWSPSPSRLLVSVTTYSDHLEMDEILRPRLVQALDL